MNSRYEGHRKIDTPYLNIAYSSYAALPPRPTGTRPTGASIDPEAPDII